MKNTIKEYGNISLINIIFTIYYWKFDQVSSEIIELEEDSAFCKPISSKDIVT